MRVSFHFVERDFSRGSRSNTLGMACSLFGMCDKQADSAALSASRFTYIPCKGRQPVTRFEWRIARRCDAVRQPNLGRHARYDSSMRW